MARLPRLVLPDWPHHVIQRGNNRQPIVRSDADRRAWRSFLAEALDIYGVRLHAYVLMDNHFHLLLTPPDAPALSRMMQSLGRRYVGAHNAIHARSGTLWEGRFRCSPVETERYLLACARYIELNPVRAGMVSHAQDHAWSSAAHHLGLKRDPLITEHPLYWDLGNTPFERQRAWRDLIESGLSEREATHITETALKGWALGSPAFVQEHEPEGTRRMAPRSRGRPRKASPTDTASAGAAPTDSD